MALVQLTPDWESPQASMLPADTDRGYVLDVSTEIAAWANPLETASALVGHAARLREQGSCLVLVSTDNGGRAARPPWRHRTCRVSERPDPREVAMAHLDKLHDEPDRVAWLRLGDGQAPPGPCAHLITDDTAPADAAHLASLLAGTAGERRAADGGPIREPGGGRAEHVHDRPALIQRYGGHLDA
ncbi:hypothetical protein FXF51_58270 [Nonomuraea sp. PA05]|uniref:hypothetical protein n=1 Tax=Nonomuraea sp. PA05 TaxID=2604466 RepID=UPI0011D5154B|nr:hypothetical protein [Nonomuraea sp. PA05]TYB47394.1 hypothetical protein FXF51_58270 [Nonomuraea sp. PA05]